MEQETATARNAKIYSDWLAGKKQKELAHDYQVHESSIKRALAEHRIDNGLPNGRKAKGD